MKNALIAILLVGLVVTGYFAALSNLRLSLEGIEGKTEKIARGDLSVPINATGQIKPQRRVEIKSEASGEVIEIARYAGDRVRTGEMIIRLQRDDEERNVNRAKLDLDVARARMEESKLRLQQAKTADLARAMAQVHQLEQQVVMAQFRLDKLGLLRPDQTNEEERIQRETTHKTQLAQLDAAKADLQMAELAVPRMEQALKQAEAAFESAQTTLADAEKRLAKTEIVSPLNGVIGEIKVQIGEVIQGGKTTLTGGTILGVVLDVDKVMVQAEVDEADIGSVLELAPAWARPGHEASIRAPDDLAAAAAQLEHPPLITVEAFRAENFNGIIERIYPESRTLSGVVTYLVEVVVTSANRTKLLPGMRADVKFTSEFVKNALLCPNEAIREGPGGGLGVHVPKKDAPPDSRETQFVDVKFGLDNGNYSQVIDGLQEGTEVYVKLPRKQERG